MLIRFARDRRGVTAIVTALGFVAAAGAAGIAIDVASWLAAKRSLQNASDQAAYSAVIGVTAGQSGYTNALAVLAQSGYGCSSAGSQNANGHLACTGSNGVSVAVNSPPTQGNYTGDSTAWEVIVSKPQQSYFTRFFLASAPTVTSRSVGLEGGNVCILALDTRTADIHSIFGGNSANVTVGGTCQVADNLLNNSDTDSVDVKSGATLNFNSLYMRVASKCDSGSCQGTLNVTNAISYNKPAVTDPYASRTIPAATGTCNQTNLVVTTTQTLNPGYYCGTGANAALTITKTSTNLTTTTNLPPNGSTSVLTFASTTGVVVGQSVSDTTHTSAISSGTVVSSFTATTVTLSTTVSGGPQGLNNHDVISFSSGAPTVTLSSGVYILDGQGGGNGANACTGTSKPSACLSGDLIVENGATLTGTGVTIVLTTSKATAVDVGNVSVDTTSSLVLTAPTSNVSGYQVQGIALWQDRLAPNPTSTDGNQYTTTTPGVNPITAATTNITGLVYFPSQGIYYQGGSSSGACTQIVSFSIVFQYSAQFNYPSTCSNSTGELPIGTTAQLGE